MRMTRSDWRKKTTSPILQDASGLQKLERTYDGIPRFFDVTLGVTRTKFFRFFSKVGIVSIGISLC
jgi:hypothetical protein